MKKLLLAIILSVISITASAKGTIYYNKVDLIRRKQMGCRKAPFQKKFKNATDFAVKWSKRFGHKYGGVKFPTSWFESRVKYIRGRYVRVKNQGIAYDSKAACLREARKARKAGY